MYVKALRLAGFKSFAAPTVLEFERGVNVIVGPNGSGKSNIADALSWVLGSQAPSELRSASMEDVIFAGSDERPSLGIADVELTLDNSSGILPLDLAEVTLGRSTDRAGETEYRINGVPCRLLDITELLSDTGIGRSIHTVVGQGQLDEILTSRPEDRRAFIEEAAQIGKYRRRKERAVRKMQRVEENLIRLEDVLGELRRALRPLKRQASTAAIYSELMTEHRELKQSLVATEVAHLRAVEDEFDPDVEAHRERLLADELASIRARVETSARERQALGERAEAAGVTANRIDRAADRLEALSRLALERADRVAARLTAETEESYRERIRLLESDAARWGRERTTLQRVATQARERAEAARSASAEAGRAVAGAEQGLSAARSRETTAAQDLVRAEGSEAAGRTTLSSIEARIQAVVEKREVAERELATDKGAVAAAEQDVRALEAELDGATETAAAAETRLEEARERAEGLRAAAGGTHAERAAADARLEAFEEVISLFPNRPEVTWRIDPLLVEARDRASAAAEEVERATGIVAEADQAVERIWLDVARHDEELHRLDALMSGAVERLAGARRRIEARAVEIAALDDEIARARDALAGAERAAIEERAALPARRAAADEAREQREEAERLLIEQRRVAAAAADEAGRAGLEARTAEERALAARLRLEEAEAGIADAQAALTGLADRRARLVAARERAESVAAAAGSAARRAEAWARTATEGAAAAREAARAAEQEVASLRTRERDLVQRIEEVTRRRNVAEVRRAETRARIEALGERTTDEWGLSLADLTGVGTLDESGIEEARERVEELERKMRRLGGVNPNAAEEYAELAEREQFLIGQIDDLRSSKRDLMKVVREVDETIVARFGEAFDDVAHEFEAVFQRLFPGGSGRLVLTEPADIGGTGIEIEARPPGKRVKKMSLLSGGERSLVALAFLFSIFRARPSPFYLLDEVEAALDDINLHRFLGLIEELEERAQVLIVTHQKRTMEVADVLYGVSMGTDGVSNVVSKRMDEMPV